MTSLNEHENYYDELFNMLSDAERELKNKNYWTVGSICKNITNKAYNIAYQLEEKENDNSGTER